MSKAHYIVPTGSSPDVFTARLGAGTGTSNNLTDLEVGKFVKLVATDRYDLCAAGDAVEAVITSIEQGTSGGYTIGGVAVAERGDMLFATADGLQATPGTGTIAAGDRVVVGTVIAKGTALTVYPKVTKATRQPVGGYAGSTLAGADTAAAVKTVLDAIIADQALVTAGLLNTWRVVSLGTVGTGAVGTTIVIEKE